MLIMLICFPPGDTDFLVLTFSLPFHSEQMGLCDRGRHFHGADK